jgi:zinc protease
MDITRAKDDFAALMVANSWLGEHRKSYSQLYKKIREARSMNYGDYTYIEWYDNGGW